MVTIIIKLILKVSSAIAKYIIVTCTQTVQPIELKFETKISWFMTYHFNKNLHSEKSDQAPLIADTMHITMYNGCPIKCSNFLAANLYIPKYNSACFTSASVYRICLKLTLRPKFCLVQFLILNFSIGCMHISMI